MVDRATCPDQKTLEKLLVGEVPDELAGGLEQHLLACPHCCQRLRELSHESSAALGTASRAAIELANERAVIEVAERAATLRFPGSSAAFTDTLAAGDTDAADGGDFRTLLDPPEAEGELGRFGGYRVLRVLGSGGMGLVWEAIDPQLRRHVALKVMKPALAGHAQHRERFLREARAAASIDHSHIVTVYQVGEHRGLPFLAMQLLRGETLDDLLRREGRLPQAECLRIGRQMAEALAVAHRRGLIHRDVKPANTWLESDGGWVKLVDFGLAHALGDHSHLTQTGTILGTPAYMSPEQARGEPVDARSDLFSLGAVLYRMATGVGPFTGPSTLAVLTSLALHHPQPPRQASADLSPEFSDLIVRLLAKGPADRPASAQAVVKAIREIEQASPKSEVQSPKADQKAADADGRDLPAGRRARWPWLMAAAAAAVLLAGIMVIVRDKDGRILGKHFYPDGQSAEVTHTDSGVASTDKRASGMRPQADEKEGASPFSDISEPPVRRGSESAGKTQDRLVAEWVHGLGGKIGGGTATANWVNVGPDDPLPDGSFSLGTVALEGPIADADLIRLNGLKHLIVLGLSRTPIGDQGIANLGNLPELVGVYIGQTNVGDAGLRDLARRFPKINTLHAGETKITDAGVPALLAWTNLQELGLENRAVTDRSIETLAKLKYLRAAYLGGTSITRSGIERLHAARPYCTIVSDFGTIAEPPIEGAASLRLNGVNDYVDIPTLRYDARRPITIEATVRREPPPHDETGLVSNLMTVDGPPGAALGWHTDSGWSFAVKTQEYRAAALAEPEPAPTQLAGVWDGRRLALYFDGKQVASADQAEAAGDGKPSGHFLIGAAPYLDGQQRYAPFMGVVDEVRISDVARYDGDYQPRSRLEADEHTLALYHFDEGEGQVLHDASGHGHDGKISGGTWVKASSADSLKAAPALRDGSASRSQKATDSPLRTVAATLPEPTPLDEWLNGRQILTVSQDGKGRFKTIQAALDALQPGQAVEVLDRGPYRETLYVADLRHAALVSRTGTVIEFTGERKPTWEKDPANDHVFFAVQDFRLSGFTFTAGKLEDRPAEVAWITFAMNGDLAIENCRFADQRPKHGGLRIYCSATAPRGSVCDVRGCLFETSATINVTGKAQNAGALIERNWIHDRSLTIHGPGKQVIVRHNVFDGENLYGLSLLQVAGIGRLRIYNNTLLSRVFSHDNLPPSGVALRNNLLLFQGVVAGPDGVASLPAAARGWEVGNNEYGTAPELTDAFPKAADDFVARPQFLSDDPARRDYLRIAADSDEAHRGAGGELPAYLGALPPGPAPKEGDWLTRWIEAQ